MGKWAGRSIQRELRAPFPHGVWTPTPRKQQPKVLGFSLYRGCAQRCPSPNGSVLWVLRAISPSPIRYQGHKHYIPSGCLPILPVSTISAASGRKFKIYFQRNLKSKTEAELSLLCPRSYSSGQGPQEHCPIMIWASAKIRLWTFVWDNPKGQTEDTGQNCLCHAEACAAMVWSSSPVL